MQTQQDFDFMLFLSEMSRLLPQMFPTMDPGFISKFQRNLGYALFEAPNIDLTLNRYRFYLINQDPVYIKMHDELVIFLSTIKFLYGKQTQPLMTVNTVPTSSITSQTISVTTTFRSTDSKPFSLKGYDIKEFLNKKKKPIRVSIDGLNVTKSLLGFIKTDDGIYMEQGRMINGEVGREHMFEYEQDMDIALRQWRNILSHAIPLGHEIMFHFKRFGTDQEWNTFLELFHRLFILETEEIRHKFHFRRAYPIDSSDGECDDRSAILSGECVISNDKFRSWEKNIGLGVKCRDMLPTSDLQFSEMKTIYVSDFDINSVEQFGFELSKAFDEEQVRFIKMY